MSQSRNNGKVTDLMSPKSKAIYTQSSSCFSQRQPDLNQGHTETLRGLCPPFDLVNKYGGKAKGGITLKT